MKPSKLIQKHLCPGCMGDGEDCYKAGEDRCLEHYPGTTSFPGGKVLLSAPVGFNRLGEMSLVCVKVFKTMEDRLFSWGEYDKFNVPVWKHKAKDGTIYVRGLMPRTNTPFLHIYESGDLSDMDCLEITESDIENMN